MGSHPGAASYEDLLTKFSSALCCILVHASLSVEIGVRLDWTMKQLERFVSNSSSGTVTSGA